MEGRSRIGVVAPPDRMREPSDDRGDGVEGERVRERVRPRREERFRGEPKGLEGAVHLFGRAEGGGERGVDEGPIRDQRPVGDLDRGPVHGAQVGRPGGFGAAPAGRGDGEQRDTGSRRGVPERGECGEGEVRSRPPQSHRLRGVQGAASAEGDERIRQVVAEPLGDPVHLVQRGGSVARRLHLHRRVGFRELFDQPTGAVPTGNGRVDEEDGPADPEPAQLFEGAGAPGDPGSEEESAHAWRLPTRGRAPRPEVPRGIVRRLR